MKLPLDSGPLLILTHDNPDPDSVASAAAMRVLLDQVRGVKGVVAYSGIIGRAENRAMVDLLHLPMKHVSQLDLASFAHVALIDAQPHTGNSALPTDRVPDIVIDHHPLRENTRRSPFYDVREELGASATLLTEYLREADVSVSPNLATALLYGIRSETHDLGREVSESDLLAYQFLFPIADPGKLATIARPTLSRRYYRELVVALASLQISEHAAICSLGEVINPDFVPEIADLAVRMEGIVWSLVHGSFDENLYVSIRTNDTEASAGDVMQSILRELGRGGGHGMRAGGKVNLGGVDLERDELERLLKERFLDETGYAEEPMHYLASEPIGHNGTEP